MGGSLPSLRDVVRQMHTVQRKAVIYTTLRIEGYLLFISGTENSNSRCLQEANENRGSEG